KRANHVEGDDVAAKELRRAHTSKLVANDPTLCLCEASAVEVGRPCRNDPPRVRGIREESPPVRAFPVCGEPRAHLVAHTQVLRTRRLRFAHGRPPFTPCLPTCRLTGILHPLCRTNLPACRARRRSRASASPTWGRSMREAPVRLRLTPRGWRWQMRV